MKSNLCFISTPNLMFALQGGSLDPFNLMIAIAGLIIAAFAAWYTYRAYKSGRAKSDDEGRSSMAAANPVSLMQRLMVLLWQYPDRGGNTASWAVKESFVLRGRLEEAKEEPGLGTAIVTTELALEVFGEGAKSRIDGLITWALARSSSNPPYLIEGKQVYLDTSEEKVVPDFRHTLAFAIILVRSGHMMDRVKTYLRYTLDEQNADGGWPPGKGRTISEVFTVLYATEFLTLCGMRNEIDQNIISNALRSRDRALGWLALSVDEEGLWNSGVLGHFSWDNVFTTAWVLHRLALIDITSERSWSYRVAESALNMIRKVGQPKTWHGTDELQRFRVEARVAASALRVLAISSRNLPGLPPLEPVESYLRDWRRRARAFAPKVAEQDWDVATAAFILESLFSNKEMREYIQRAGLTTVCT